MKRDSQLALQSRIVAEPLGNKPGLQALPVPFWKGLNGSLNLADRAHDCRNIKEWEAIGNGFPTAADPTRHWSAKIRAIRVIRGGLMARLLDDGFLHDYDNMKSCDICVGIVVRKQNNISSFRIHCGVVGRRNSIFTPVARPNRKRNEWGTVQ